MTTLFIDFNNLAIRTIFSDKETINNPTPDWNLHKHNLLQSLFYNIRKFNPSRVVLAIDDSNNWRKKIYPEYKTHRKDKKDKDIFPWDEFYKYLNEYLKELEKVFPFYFIQSPYTEADDVIAVLSKHIDGDKVVVSADSDYIQLLSIPNLKLYNPLKEKFTEDINPQQTTLIKIIAGDSGDNIPNIKPKIGPKTAEKLILNNGLEDFIKENNLQENFDRNQKLIDWNYIPDIIKKKVLELWFSYKIQNTNINSIELFNFFIRHRLKKQLEEIKQIKLFLKPLIDKYIEDDFKKICDGEN